MSVLGDYAHALTANGHDASEDGTGRGTPIVAPTLKSAAGKGGNYGPGMPMVVVNALDRQGGGPDDNAAQAGHVIAFHALQDPISQTGYTPAIGKTSLGMGVSTSTAVRRLTPRECERLMSWPDEWTAPPGVRAPDSRRYAACGDGVVANVAEWLGRRILAVEAAS